MNLSLYDYLRVSHIKRWHNVNTVRQQTVAEHSYMVALIALDLFNYIVGVKDDESGAFHMLIAAMFHDTPEVASGDTPTPAKRLIREITGVPEIFDKIDKRLMPTLPYINVNRVVPALEDFIKMADAIEGYHFIHDNGAGTHAQIVISGARRKMEDMVEKLYNDTEGGEWYQAVNRVLTALGLPYVHRESRISPP
jgi:5'-deoxynucleotidase